MKESHSNRGQDTGMPLNDAHDKTSEAIKRLRLIENSVFRMQGATKQEDQALQGMEWMLSEVFDLLEETRQHISKGEADEECQSERLREVVADALFAFDQGRTQDAIDTLRDALDGGGDTSD